MNIILYVMDALRPDFLSCYGFEKNTSPNIDALTGDGVLYENAYATSTWTKTSAASILTSQYPRSLKMMHKMDIMPDYESTLPTLLKQSGFQCYAISANLFFSPNFGFSGFDEFHVWPSEKQLKKRKPIPVDVKVLEKFGIEKMIKMPSEDINERLFRILENNRNSNLFIMAWSLDTHSPYYVLGNKSFFGNSMNDFILQREVTFSNLEKVQSLYCEMIRYNDYHIGNLISKLKELNLYKDSLIIITADHGDAFGEHRSILGKPVIGHTGIPYEQVIKVPLIIKFPQNEHAGEKYRGLVQLTDIYPTILDVCGITYKIDIEGSTLNLDDDSFKNERVIFVESQISLDRFYSSAIRIGRHKLIRIDTKLRPSLNLKKFARNVLDRVQCPSIQFYNLDSDPDEEYNLRTRKKDQVSLFLNKYNEIKSRCDRKTESIKSKKHKSIDEDVKKHLKLLGYLD